jgi:hypothetical protein
MHYGAPAAGTGVLLGRVEVEAERTPSVTGGDHRPNSQIGMPATLCGFQ